MAKLHGGSLESTERELKFDFSREEIIDWIGEDAIFPITDYAD